MPNSANAPVQEAPSSHPRPLSLSWWVRDHDGKVVLAQAPNAALSVWLVSVVVGWTHLLDDHRDSILTWVGQGALLAWALDELFRGVVPARRLLGAVVAVVMVVRLFG